MRYNSWPTPERGEVAVQSVIRDMKARGYGGTDIEFLTTGQITIIGVATEDRCAAAFWQPSLGEALYNSQAKLYAFAGITADKPLLDRVLWKTPLSQWVDSMLLWWIAHPDLASVPKSLYQEDSDDAGLTLGMLNLWACTSYLQDVPQWKRHWSDADCAATGRPCPKCAPLDYCSVDSWAGLVDGQQLESDLQGLKIPSSYYDFRAGLTDYCYQMQQKGVAVDLSVVEGIEELLKTKKTALFPVQLEWEGKLRKNGTRPKLKKPRKVFLGPFNPSSPKAVTEWFTANGINLRDRMGKPSMGKQIVLKAVDKYLRPYGLKFNLRDAVPEGPAAYEMVLPEPVDLLVKLAQKSCLFKGTAPWFDNKYIENNRIHARFNSCGTSMTRLSSSKPNLTNVVRSGFGAETRKAIKAEPGCVVVKADYKSLELHVTLWWSRSSKSGEGIFEHIVEGSDGQFELAAAQRALKPRDIAKSGLYGSQYGEGMVLLTPKELSSSTRYAERKAGALVVFDGVDNPEWTFRGRVVCFTGANLAERIFGDRTRENRAKALKLQELIFSRVPEIREVFHRETMLEIENSGEVRLPSGHRLPLYGRDPVDDVKQALACKGQGGGAIYVQEKMLLFGSMGRVANIVVHDEVVMCDIPELWSNEQIGDYMRPLVGLSDMLPGFHCPIEVKKGPNWGSTEPVAVLRYEPTA